MLQFWETFDLPPPARRRGPLFNGRPKMESLVNDYEVTYILRPNLEEADVEARANAIGEIIKGQGGEIVAIEKLGKKRLAYEINDLREGNYVVMQFKATGVASKELERQMKLHEDVIRHLVIALDKQALQHMAWLAQQVREAPVAPAYGDRPGGYDRPRDGGYDRPREGGGYDRPREGGGYDRDRGERSQAPYERN